MADVVLTVQNVGKAGVAPSYLAIDATDVYYLPHRAGKTFLHFLNTGTISTVTFDIVQTVEGEPITDRTLSVPATTGDVMVAVSKLFEQISGVQKGRVKFSQDVASGVTVASLRL